MQAIYISSTQFKVSTDKTEEFLTGRRVRALCGSEYKYSTVQSSTYSSPDTTVTLEEGELTSNLSEVHYGIINIGEQGSFPKHSHDGNEGTGGVLSLLNLEDTPSVYNNGKYLRSTTSGVEFTDLNDYYYTESEVDTISGSLQTNINGKAGIVHTHDDRYYTESEVDTISGSLQTNIDVKPDTEVFLVEGSPSSSIGKENDIAVNQEIGNIYEKDFVIASTTWNPSDKNVNITLSNGNLTVTATSSSWKSIRAVIGKSSGKWYWETTIDVGATNHMVGIGTTDATLNNYCGYDEYGYSYQNNGYKYHNLSSESFGDTYTVNDVIGVALDLDNGKIWFSKNGVWQASGNPSAGTNEAYSGLSGTFFPMYSPYESANAATSNFGASAFSYSVPSGFSSGLGGGLVQWTKKLTPDFLKLSDTPTTYSGVSGKYLKTTTSGIEFSDDEIYTKSEIDTISGTLQTNIDGKSDIAHNHDDRYYTETELNNGQLDNRYYTESETDTISGSLQTNIDSMPVTLLDLLDTPTTYSGSVGKYLKTTSSGIIFSDIDSEYWESVDVFLDENYSNDKGLPTQVERGLFKGYSMPIWSTPANQYEELVFRIRAPFRWDGVTNPTFMILVSISATEDIGDNFKFQMEWESKGVSNVIPDTTAEVLTDELAVTNGTAYYSYLASASLDATKLIVGDNLQFRVRRVTATDPQVSNEIIIWHWDSRWKMNKLGTVSE